MEFFFIGDKDTTKKTQRCPPKPTHTKIQQRRPDDVRLGPYTQRHNTIKGEVDYVEGPNMLLVDFIWYAPS